MDHPGHHPQTHQVVSVGQPSCTVESGIIDNTVSVGFKPIGLFHLCNGLLTQLHKRETEEVGNHS